MVKRVVHTPEGITTIELTSEEVKSFAERGDIDCRNDLAASKLKTATTVADLKKVLSLILTGKEV